MMCPGIHIVGTYGPPFRPLTSEEDAEIVKAINLAAPDVLWVGIEYAKAGDVDARASRAAACSGDGGSRRGV